MTSEYHLIQFVLHTAAIYGGDWDEFMRKTAKIFKGNIPPKLLLGLRRNGCPELKTLCARYMLDNMRRQQRILQQTQEHREKVKRWEERRNKGNHTAWCKHFDEQKKIEAHRQEIKKQTEIQAMEDYIQKMKTQWDRELQGIKDKYDNDIQLLCQKLHGLDV